MRSGGKTGEEGSGRTILLNMVDAECHKSVGPSAQMTGTNDKHRD